jgi:hypothetical protein
MTSGASLKREWIAVSPHGEELPFTIQVAMPVLQQSGVTDRPNGATDDRRNGATFWWLKRDSNGVSGCGVFGVLCNR